MPHPIFQRSMVWTLRSSQSRYDKYLQQFSSSGGSLYATKSPHIVVSDANPDSQPAQEVLLHSSQPISAAESMDVFLKRASRPSQGIEETFCKVHLPNIKSSQILTIPFIGHCPLRDSLLARQDRQKQGTEMSF